MHGVDGDQGAGQAEPAEQSLDGRNLVGFVVAIEVRQHQLRVGREGAENVRGAAVEKVVEAAPQRLAVDRHVTLSLEPGWVVQRGGMAGKRGLDGGSVELLQDAADRRVGWRPPPGKAERVAEPGEV